MDTRMTKRRNFSDQFKAAVAFEALRGDKTVQEIAAKGRISCTTSHLENPRNDTVGMYYT